MAALSGSANGDAKLDYEAFNLEGQVDGNLRVQLTNGEVKEVNGRVYHDDHFNHGVLLSANADGEEVMPVSRKPTAGQQALNGRAGTKDLTRELTKNQGPVSLGTPMPKWPVGHTSAAFEAVSQKKSFILSPAEIYAECAHHGEEKCKFPWYKIWTLSIIAGCYVGFGFTLCLMVAGNMLQAPGVSEWLGRGMEENYGLYKLVFGAVGFPFSFTTIVVCGSELYTSLCAYTMAAMLEGRIGVLDTLRMLVVSWTGNFLGCALMAGLFCAADIYDHHDYTLHRTVHDKISHGWGATFVKGIFANWLVGIATWMANAAQDLTGKAVAIWLPISAFAMIGFEHCIANMFLFVMSWAQGGHTTAKQFIWHNLIPATLGNWVGGAVCLACVYGVAYGRPGLKLGEMTSYCLRSKKRS